MFRINARLKDGFDRMFRHFGPRGWWPGDTPFEVMVGAILTQNTNWKNVEKAISNIKAERLLSPKKLLDLHTMKLAALIRPAGYYRLKAGRLKNYLRYFVDRYDGDAQKMSARPAEELRAELLSVKGIGPETADSILLYALDKPVFVIDAYTKRILARHAICAEEATYDELQEIFVDAFDRDAEFFNEYHALIVETGKDFCRKDPRCGECPLRGWNGLPSTWV